MLSELTREKPTPGPFFCLDNHSHTPILIEEIYFNLVHKVRFVQRQCIPGDVHEELASGLHLS